MKFNKLLAGTAAFIMTVTSLATVANAADATVAVKADKVTAKVGADYTLNVSLDDVPTSGLNAVEFKVTYDPKIVSVTSVEAGSLATTKSTETEDTFASNTANSGEIDVSWTTGLTSSEYSLTKNGTFFTIKGKVADSAKAGDVSPFKIEAIDRDAYEGATTKNTDIILANVDADGKATTYTPDITDGSVTVADDSTEPTETEAPTTTTAKATEAPTESQKPTESGDDSSSTPVSKYGDVDESGEVNVADVVLLNKYLVGADTITEQGKANAACLDDGKLDSKDASSILAYLASLCSYEDLPVTEVPADK